MFDAPRGHGPEVSDSTRRAVARRRAAPAAGATEAQRWSSPGAGPRGARGHPVPLAHRLPVEGAAERVQLRVDLPLAHAGVGPRRGVHRGVRGAAQAIRPAAWDPVAVGGLGRRDRQGAKGGDRTGPNPTDRAKQGTKRHLLTDGRGVPLSAVLSAANVHDKWSLAETLDRVVLRTPRGA